MYLANDFVHPTARGGRCRVRIYLPEEERDTTVVICSELPINKGLSIIYSAHQIGAEVISYHKLSLPVWSSTVRRAGDHWSARLSGC